LRTIKQILVALILCGALVSAAAAPPVVGVAQGSGDLRIDHAAVSGNGTLFDGSLIETGATRSELTLNGGSSLTLIGSSRAKIFSDRLVLESGGVELNRGGGFSIAARDLSVSSSQGQTRLQVAVDDTPGIRVAAIQGEAEVRSSEGVLVARVRPGMALALNPGAGAGAPAARLVGVVRKIDGKYFLTDETTNVTVELRGEDLMLEPGQRVEAVGKILEGVESAPGAAHVVEVETASPSGSAAASGAGKAAAAAGTSKGISGTTIAILGGVGAAGTIGALYATDVIGDDDEDSVSR
jgi:hypothetical protein